jgi:hypothetical protein
MAIRRMPSLLTQRPNSSSRIVTAPLNIGKVGESNISIPMLNLHLSALSRIVVWASCCCSGPVPRTAPQRTPRLISANASSWRGRPALHVPDSVRPESGVASPRYLTGRWLFMARLGAHRRHFGAWSGECVPSPPCKDTDSASRLAAGAEYAVLRVLQGSPLRTG